MDSEVKKDINNAYGKAVKEQENTVFHDIADAYPWQMVGPYYGGRFETVKEPTMWRKIVESLSEHRFSLLDLGLVYLGLTVIGAVGMILLSLAVN